MYSTKDVYAWLFDTTIAVVKTKTGYILVDWSNGKTLYVED